ncbi:hypothetical protein AAFF_G00267220 [Aldrovandia affinis]|uniref:Uncharacterized protein n=1 Tax=Aldrovandia affinis TaxID=143900 RepID=A0AAD7RBS4_9TELE|nr:hypothetical protein AAFF_G00267220 [Aldrovandia affinis]
MRREVLRTFTDTYRARIGHADASRGRTCDVTSVESDTRKSLLKEAYFYKCSSDQPCRKLRPPSQSSIARLVFGE